MHPWRLLACCLLAGALHAGVAAAAEPEAQAAAPGIRYAEVLRVRGEVTAASGDAAPARELREGNYVFVGERIRTSATGEAVLKTDDAGYIALRPRADFVMERYAARGTAADAFALRVVQGGLRVISGWISRTNRSQHVVLTPTATIGIRGTDHEPYVMTPELAESMQQLEGTYDKVNRGGATLEVSGNRLDVDPGRVGFVRGRGLVTRGLLTVLLPVLLDRVPDFYVPGAFDDELDKLSVAADEEARRALETLRATTPGAPPPADGVPPPAEPAVPAPPIQGKSTPPARKAGPDACRSDAVARTWLAEFDSAIQRRDAPAVIRRFAPDASIRARVRGADGQLTALEVTRDEFVRSTIDAMAGLTDFQQRRPSIEAAPAGEGPRRCDRIRVRSLVIEQGRRDGKPYRFESVEEFLLEWREGSWLAIRAEATQQ